MAKTETKFIAGNYYIKGTLEPLDDGRIEVRFHYNKILLEEIKAFETARWNPEKKCWTIKDTPRNHFQLDYLQGKNPYARFDKPLVEYTPDHRPVMKHQIMMVRAGLTYHTHILGAQMGTGKSLAAIRIMELSGFKDWFWVAPKSALRAVQLECEKWNCSVKPTFLTYEALKKMIENWPKDKLAPHGVIFDESSRAKNPTAQRSQAALELANGIRKDWGDDGYIIEMSGTPAPKSPADWWMQCEIACPGFLREGTIEKFKKRLGLIIMKESIAGGTYPELVTWLDDEKKCLTCGQLETHLCHDPIALVTPEVGNYHLFVKSKNEVAFLYERMKGLVSIFFKKDCLDLPEKRYEVIRCKPSPSILRSASIITARSSTVVGAMTLLRELSDGFQYNEEETGTTQCSLCKGKLKIQSPIKKVGEQNFYNAMPDPDTPEVDNADDGVISPPWGPEDERYDDTSDPSPKLEQLTGATEVEVDEYEDGEIPCPKCGGSGETATYKRTAIQVPCPKEDAVRELLDLHDEVGRTVFYAGFSGSVDRVANICRKAGWQVIQVDGRGWKCTLGPMKETDMLKKFQEGSTNDCPRLAFVGQPSAAGMGITLTKSAMICFYSNDFNSESRSQAEDRIHRPGMDYNRGATIYDLIHLPTDERVINNLQKKKDLMHMSMGEIKAALEQVDTNGERKL